eukprot:gene16087-11510_t
MAPTATPTTAADATSRARGYRGARYRRVAPLDILGHDHGDPLAQEGGEGLPSLQLGQRDGSWPERCPSLRSRRSSPRGSELLLQRLRSTAIALHSDCVSTQLPSVNTSAASCRAASAWPMPRTAPGTI